MTERHCIECGEPFTQKRREGFCSKACRERRQRRQIRRWFRDNDRKMRAYWKRYHAEHLDKRRAANRANYYKRKAAS